MILYVKHEHSHARHTSPECHTALIQCVSCPTQVWRPSLDNAFEYRLVGQTFFQPPELRFQEVALEPSAHIKLQRGDVLGLYFPQFNPLAWSAVPCAYPAQRHLYLHQPQAVGVGVTSHFQRAQAGPHACRHYSFIAVLGERGWM